MYIFDFRLKIFWSYIDTLGRPRIWYWLQNFYHCRSGTFVRDICQLDSGTDFLDWHLVRRENHAERKSQFAI